MGWLLFSKPDHVDAIEIYVALSSQILNNRVGAARELFAHFLWLLTLFRPERIPHFEVIIDHGLFPAHPVAHD